MFSKLKKYAVIAGSAFLVVLTAYAKGRSAGKESQLNKNKINLIDNVKDAHEIEIETSGLSASDVSDRLRKEWQRD